MKKNLSIGGQAVIEGVVMRGPKYIATAVRRKNNTIEVKKVEFTSVTTRIKILGLPVIRGFISLLEVLIIGYRTLSFSAHRAELDSEEQPLKGEKKKSRENLEMTLTLLFAFGFAFLIFTYLPYQIAYLLKLSDESIYFNLFTGLTRIVFFVAYVKIISMLKDVTRVFEYHGAEHKAVHCYEQNMELSTSSVDKFTTIHPRCGTSFVFLVLLISIVIFSLLDHLVALRFGIPKLFSRIGYHMLIFPLISGISYEVLKYSGKKLDNPLVKIFTKPGMLLQRITTQPPDLDQLEVAIVALRAALEMDTPETAAIQYIEVD